MPGAGRGRASGCAGRRSAACRPAGRPTNAPRTTSANAVVPLPVLPDAAEGARPGSDACSRAPGGILRSGAGAPVELTRAVDQSRTVPQVMREDAGETRGPGDGEIVPRGREIHDGRGAFRTHGAHEEPVGS